MQWVLLQQMRLLGQQGFAVQAHAVLAALPGNTASGKGGLAGIAQMLLQGLLQFFLVLLQCADLVRVVPTHKGVAELGILGKVQRGTGIHRVPIAQGSGC